MQKIFIIEDDEFNSNILTIALGTKYSLFTVSDNANLIERISDFMPDLIITDNFVGQTVAADIIKQIRSDYRISHIPIILFSGHPNLEKLSKEIEATSYLSKPFALKDLNACIETVLTSATNT